MRRILCYGDSNTWGYTAGTGVRYTEQQRWTGVLQRELGDGYAVIEEGLNGRTTVFDNPALPGRNGLDYLLPCLFSQKPLDLVVLMLGSNDIKYVNAVAAATGADELVRMLLNADGIYRCSQPIWRNGPKVLLIAPPLIAPEIETLFPNSTLVAGGVESPRFAQLYANVAKNRGVHFLDAALYTEPSLVDCVHITAESHARLGAAIAEKIKEIFSENAD